MDLTNLTEEFVKGAKGILKENLCGVYLHGSAVMGCFNPKKSDVDLIFVVEHGLSDGDKRAFLDLTVELNAVAPPKGIEMSVVRRAVCNPFVYPTPYELHFSAGYLDWYREDPADYIKEMQGTDVDLAAHFTVIRARGKCLFGPPIGEVFGEVPKEDYLDSIVKDISGAREEITEYPLYLTLNLARVLAYCREGAVLSKKEGGEWAQKNLPAEFRRLIETALREYVKSARVTYDGELAKRYADYMLKEILLTVPA